MGLIGKGIEIVVVGKDQASTAFDGIDKSMVSMGDVGAAVATGGLAMIAAAVVAVGAAAVAVGVQIAEFLGEAEESMNLFQAQTGATTEELAEFRDVAADVYAAGLGESFGDVTAALATVHKGLELTGEDLEAATRKAMTLETVFELDVAESIGTVSSMMTNFGIESDNAFDALTWGLQNGLDRFGDLGDTLHEYSGDFSRLGFTVEDTLAMLNAGLEAGAYNTDVIADGWREYGIRLTEGGDDISAVFEQMGMDFEGISDSVRAGDETWGDYASNVVEGLMGIEDVVERNIAGTTLFGTKWEDIGGDVFLASGEAIEGIEGIEGATDAAGEAMDRGLKAAIERLKRKVEVEFLPLGDEIADMLDEYVLPRLDEWAEWMTDNLPLAIEELMRRITNLMSFLDLLGGVVEKVSELADEYLTPALDRLAAVLGDDEGATDDLSESFSILDAMGYTVMSVLYALELTFWAIGGAVDAVSASVWIVKHAFEDAKTAVGNIKGVIDDVKGAFDSFKRMVDGFNLPWWLTPGSPTPLETGLIGIGEAIEGIPSLSASMDVGGMTMAGATAGGGGVIINNYFGVDSVRSEEDINTITQAQERSFRLRSAQVVT